MGYTDSNCIACDKSRRQFILLPNLKIYRRPFRRREFIVPGNISTFRVYDNFPSTDKFSFVYALMRVSLLKNNVSRYVELLLSLKIKCIKNISTLLRARILFDFFGQRAKFVIFFLLLWFGRFCFFVFFFRVYKDGDRHSGSFEN